MGDRIKFGPEWLRNLAPGTSGSGNNNHNVAMPSSPTPGGASGGPPGGHTSTGSNTPNTFSPKVLLAKLRYGREEMLALYENSSEAPPELKYIETLYQPRGKPPFALNNSFEDELRENMNQRPSLPPGTGASSPGERFSSGRGGSLGRGLNVSDRGRPRAPFVRQPSAGRGTTTTWHHGSPRMPGYSGGADDDSTLNLRSSWSASNGGNTANRSAGEQAEGWTPSKMFRKRPGQTTNWRQSREEGEEWRSPDAGRSRGNNQQEKWERDWGDRQGQDKNQAWSSNRRTWVGGDTQNDDNLPEWAVDNAEACGGTFDSSGAFHGYSNDDSNLPKNQDSAYPLTRSHTHGSFARSKTVEEGSEEWWASEKAKKLSPKRFDASDVKFKKQSSAADAPDSTTAETKSNVRDDLQEIPEKLVEVTSSSGPQPGENATGGASDDDKFKNSFKPKFSESKTFDALMPLSDMSLEDTTDDRSNFQSVMITPNNSLRQKHQNIVSAASEVPVRDTNNGKPGILQLIQSPGNQSLENEMRVHKSSEDKIVDDIFDMTLEDKEVLAKHPKPISSPMTNQPTSSISSTMASIVSSMPNLQNSVMQMQLTNPVFANPGLMAGKPNMQGSMQGGMPSGMQGMPGGIPGMPAGLQGLPGGLQMAGLPPSLQVAGMPSMGMQGGGMPPSAMQGGVNQAPGIPGNQLPSGMQQAMQAMQQGSGLQQALQQGIQGSGMQQALQNAGMQQALQGGLQQVLQNSGMQGPGMQSSGLQGSGMQPGGMQNSGMQSVGITNSALNASLGLPIRTGNNAIGMPLQGVPPPVMPNSGMANPGMGSAGMQAGMGGGQLQPGSGGIPSFPNAGGLPGISSANSSLFMSQNSNNPAMGSPGDIPMPNQHGQSNMFPIHGLQHSGSQAAFGSSIYSNIMQQTPTQNPSNAPPGDLWYYEDPEKNIQGPFSPKDMYNWYRAGFFSPSLMVRRACDSHMRPLGSYGPVVPFATMDMMTSYQLTSGFDRSPGSHETMLNSQPSLGLESVDSLWSQPSAADLLWMQQAMSRNDNRVNNLPIYFWEQQPSAIASNALLPEEIAKEMKTEDQILAQLRASQNMGTPQNMPFMNEQASGNAPSKMEEAYATTTSATPDMEELQKLIQKDTLTAKPAGESGENTEAQSKPETTSKVEPATELANQKPQQQQVQQQQQQQNKSEPKQTKQLKTDEKATKNKENSATKTKNKKKDEKKDDLESKPKEEEAFKSEKRSDEPSPAKSKKEDKTNKKELEKEKKEWLKEGFTIVKGSEKSSSKDNKKKAEEAKAAEEAERKKKEEEKLVADEEKKRKQTEAAFRKQQETQQQQQRQAAESVVKKAPWSAVANQGMFATNKDGLSLTEIQRLEREKKLEQIKEQQQMMQIIAQQQAAALAREQEMQAGLGWAKKKGNNNSSGQSLAEIQAEARKQAAAAAAAVAAAAAAQALEETAQPPVNHVPWGNAPNGAGGFWDSPPNQPSKSSEKPQESPKAVETKKKKTTTVNAPVKKETTPAVEFESWCTTVLTSWSSKIDVPTFVGFLKDIESPYEVKDYVKCYLGESKDSSDFARQFLERRSKLLRVGMVTPSDDLCSPAMAVNPRTTSNSDYQEVKGKGKKTKKNKMLKVDARILGFSVTAAEDRINVGDIDTV